ncbi:Alpha/Beta hydrolase protein [Gilbertella persicaria]|uniref:Alpha/Beta hydrolase protein n=1 Tax=Gilbertella persicaria TaxID=101096 RepID=UPI00221EA578|nr:Alpha/Beta hydrolase protein [Gilbertella persicaria]KAI8066287.1 Alpha/Beta hydrolase protein [Gilbertella persicaria]
MSTRSPNLHHVKGSRSLDASHSESSKVTHMKQPHHSIGHYSTPIDTYHHTHSRSNSTQKKSTSLNSTSMQPERDYTSRHAKTSLSGTPIFIEKKQSHYSLLKAFQQQQGTPEPVRSRPWPYLGYMINSFKNLFLTFYFNWPLFFTAPVSSAALLMVYPTTMTFLVMFEIGLKLFMVKLEGWRILKYMSVKYGEGFSAINWGSPEFMLSDSSAQLVLGTLPILGTPASPISVSGCRRRTFDLSIAQSFVLLSSLIYERDTIKVKEAYDLYMSSRDDQNKRASDITKANSEYIIESRMKELLWESEARIRQIAETWGLHFAGVSELKSLGGPFCGIFWSETMPFIIVAFKGTTPTNYEEFLVDATFQRTDARSFLFGCVHEGFYESLFSTTGFGDQDIRDPYGAILAAVQAKAAQIQEQLHTTAPVQLWITGHSLGAALSSLLYARWLKCPQDLSDRLVLRDCYIIGTPAVGDSDFASNFSSHTNLPVTRSSTLWRIINKSDIFSRLPPGYDSKTCGHFISENDFFNYSHIGHTIHITREWHTKPLKSYPSSYQPPMQVNIVMRHQQPVRNHKKLLARQYENLPLPNLPKWATLIKNSWVQRYLPHGNPIYFIEKMYPFFLMDHMPSQYFHGLQRARLYYEKEEEDMMHLHHQFVTESLALDKP